MKIFMRMVWTSVMNELINYAVYVIINIHIQ